MPEQQDVQTLFRFEELQSLFPLEKNDRYKALLSMVPFEYNDRFEPLNIWINTFLCFENKMSFEDLTEEYRRSIEEEKQLFFKKIGIDEDSFKDIIKHGIDFFLRFYRSSTVEEFESIKKERNVFLEDNRNFTTALYNYILEKKRNSLPLLPLLSSRTA